MEGEPFFSWGTVVTDLKRTIRRARRRLKRNAKRVVPIVGLVVLAMATVFVVASALRPGPEVTQAAAPKVQTVTPSAAATCTLPYPQLKRTATALAGSPETVKVAVLGDSTRDERAAGLPLMQALRAELPGVPAGNIVSFGKNGAPLAAYSQMDDVQASIRDFKPTLIELSIGINDLRFGTVAPESLTQNLEAYVAKLHADIPTADIIISVPGALSTHDIGAKGYVKGSDGVVNPPGAAQAVTTGLRGAYLAVAKKLDYVALNDVQAKITGTDADPSEPALYVGDQLHPTAATSKAIAKLITAAITCA